MAESVAQIMARRLKVDKHITVRRDQLDVVDLDVGSMDGDWVTLIFADQSYLHIHPARGGLTYYIPSGEAKGDSTAENQ